MADFVLKKGDTGLALAATLTDENGAFDLTGYTVTFDMRNESTKTAVVSGGACTVVSAAAGTVTYSWATADVGTAGNFEGEFTATLDADTTKEVRFPRSSTDFYLDIQIIDSLA